MAVKGRPQTEIAFAPAPPPTTAQLRAEGVRQWNGDEDPDSDGGFLEVFAAAVARVGTKECVHLFNVQPSMLPDALKERERKGPRLDWLVILLVAAPEPVKHELIARLNAIAGYRPPQRRRELTEAEELRIWKRATARLAPGIVADIEQEVDEG